MQSTWYCRTAVCWLILLRISNKALTEISKRLPLNQRSCPFLCLLSMPHSQHPTMSGSDAAVWHTVTTGDQRLLRTHSRSQHQGRNRNETKIMPKYSEREKKEVRPFYYIEASLEFQSRLNLLKADLIATGTSNSIPASLICPWERHHQSWHFAHIQVPSKMLHLYQQPDLLGRTDGHI